MRLNPWSQLSVLRWLLSVAVCGASAALHAASTPPAPRTFAIEAADAAVALVAFGEQARTAVVYLVSEVRGVRTKAVSGSLTPLAALQKMLEGTPLVATQDARTEALIVQRRSATTMGPTGGGALTGVVSSVNTKNYLEGAIVEIPSLDRRTLTDRVGAFSFSNLPFGDFELRVTYTGFETQNRTVIVTTAQSAKVEVELGEEVMRMSKFVVQTEREGQALAVTSQRNADNVKNVAALDAFGNLPNLSAGELAVRLPGVSAALDNEGNITGVLIRGTPANMNRVEVDGNVIANSGGYDRSFQMQSMTGAMFEQLELTKGQTPDRSADSLGGSINLITRSPLDMKERRRVNYNLGARWAPSFIGGYTPSREAHPMHPLLNFGYQEVFDAFGGERNLGVFLNAFYSENVNAPRVINYDYQNTATLPSYLYNYTDLTRYANRKQTALNLKVDYRLSSTTKISFGSIYNDADEFANYEFSARAFANQAPASFDAGFTSKFTQARPVAGSNVELSALLQGFLNRTRSVDFGAEHRWERLSVDYNASYSQAHVNLNHGKHNTGGTFTMRALNVGWALDTSDATRPRFHQNGGPGLSNPATYINTFQITDLQRDSDRDSEVWNAKANATYRLGFRFPADLKAGMLFRQQSAALRDRGRRYNYIGKSPLPAGTTQPIAVEKAWGIDLPFVDPASLDGQLGDPALWSEDVYYRESQKYTGTSNGTEEIYAGYVMTKMKLGKLGVVAGMRSETTDVRGFGHVRVNPGTVAQYPDPASRAEHDWNHPRTNTGGYTRSFPSVHLNYEVAPDLKARASWSTSFGRPSFQSLLPTATINSTSDPKTVTTGNPALGPQYARNIDLTLEYYLKPAGVISVGYFEKRISDYILTAQVGVVADGVNNGYLGDYAGYQLLSQTNAGTAEIKGWEFDYRQQLTFLPGWLKGLTVSANYTFLATSGDFGGASQLKNDEVAGFIPRSANAGIGYTFGKFTFRSQANYNGAYLGTYADTLPRRVYRMPRTVVNLGVSYAFRPALMAFCDVVNVFNDYQRTYRYVPIQPAMRSTNGPALTFGLSGRF